MSRFLDALHSGRVLLMDGAMGTELQRTGIRASECYEQWNLTHPDRVRANHQAYVDAGADVLVTNTFQLNRTALARHGLADQHDNLGRRAVELARQAAGAERFVLASIGPLGDRGPSADYRALATGWGADGLLIETASHVNDLIFLQEVLAEGSTPESRPLLFSWTFRRTADGQLRTHTDLAPEACARAASQHGIAALGVNCGRDIGMSEMAEIIRRFRRETDLPLFARPNLGTPTQVEGRWVYPHGPEQMVERLPELLAAGVTMVGGCCGTTPAHIAAFRRVVEEWNRRQKRH